MVAITTYFLLRSLKRRSEMLPFLLTLALFGLSLLGLGISMWPDVIPGRVTIWQAAALRQGQLGWLVVIWGASVAPLGVVSILLRAVLHS